MYQTADFRSRDEDWLERLLRGQLLLSLLPLLLLLMMSVNLMLAVGLVVMLVLLLLLHDIVRDDLRRHLGSGALG